MNIDTETTNIVMAALNNCDREPIHIPGAIQPHGVLFVLDPSTFQIRNCSENVGEFFGKAPQQLVGFDFLTLIQEPQRIRLQKALSNRSAKRFSTHRLRVLGDDVNHFDCSAHIFKNNIIVELEPATQSDVGAVEMFEAARSSAGRMRQLKNIDEASALLVNEVRAVTGFDRVVLYKFDNDWNGHVIAEAKSDTVESYLDLHFPATDIPQQVRNLFVLNRMRLIPEVHFKPSRLWPAEGIDGLPIDLSLSVLRNVSPIHVEYLKNMKVNASMSCSIIKDGKLWGLVSCVHEAGTKRVDSNVRFFVDYLSEAYASLLFLSESENDLVTRAELTEAQSDLISKMSDSEIFMDGLIHNPALYLRLGGATSGAVLMDGMWYPIGDAPGMDQLNLIREIVEPLLSEDVFTTSSLSKIDPRAIVFKDKAAGVACFSTSRAQTTYFFWFRPEVIQTVKWGGNPNKPVEVEAGQHVLHPRKSFEIWKQNVQHNSFSWSAETVRAISRFKAGIIQLVMEKMEKISQLNLELERSNTELDSFAYAASHDMKEPLRGIHNYAALLLQSPDEKISDAGKSRLETILRLTQRSEDLINSLLHYSQLGRTDIQLSSTSLNEVAKKALDSLRSRIEEEQADVQISDLPAVLGDAVQLIEVFTNLMTNGLKYNLAEHKVITIGPTKVDDENFVGIYVKDNGIGIEEIHQSAVFKIFKRLHARNKFGGGSGTGLTIVKRIVERHGGRVWVDSKPKEGTTFFFTLPRAK